MYHLDFTGKFATNGGMGGVRPGFDPPGWGGVGAMPRMFGRYHVIDRLGEDALGMQFLARLEGPNGFQRWAALLSVHPRLASDPAFVHSFYEGARLAARVQHPNVATTFDVSEGDGVPWVALEYVHGEPVRDLIDRSIASGASVPWDVACRVVAEAALGIDAIVEQRNADVRAHGVVLPPIAPGRLVVTYDGKTKVTHGCLPLFSDAAALPYCSPERIRALLAHPASHEDDVRSDVFALGVILWEAVAGRRLFAGLNKEDTEERIKAHIVPPLRSLVRCPTKLDEIVHTALARYPAERFSNPRALARALETVIVSKGLVLTDDDVGTYLHGIFQDRFEERQRRLVTAANVTEVFRHEDVERALSLTKRSQAPNTSPDGSRSQGRMPVAERLPQTLPSAAMPAAAPVEGSGRLSSFPSTSAMRTVPAAAAVQRPRSFPSSSAMRTAPSVDASQRLSSFPSASAMRTVPSAVALPAPAAPPAPENVPADAQADLIDTAVFAHRMGPEPQVDDAPTVPRLTEDAMPPSSIPPQEPQLPPPPPPPPPGSAWAAVHGPPPVVVQRSGVGPWRWVLLATVLGGLASVVVWSLRARPELADNPAEVAAPTATPEPAPPATAPTSTAAASASAVASASASAGASIPTAVASAPETAPPPTAAPPHRHHHHTATGEEPAQVPAAPTAGEPTRTGLLTVVCMPACDDVLDGRRSLGPSPVFKVALPAGPHKLTLRRSDPTVEKVIEVNVVPDETTTVRPVLPD